MKRIQWDRKDGCYRNTRYTDCVTWRTKKKKKKYGGDWRIIISYKRPRPVFLSPWFEPSATAVRRFSVAIFRLVASRKNGGPLKLQARKFTPIRAANYLILSRGGYAVNANNRSLIVIRASARKLWKVLSLSYRSQWNNVPTIAKPYFPFVTSAISLYSFWWKKKKSSKNYRMKPFLGMKKWRLQLRAILSRIRDSTVHSILILIPTTLYHPPLSLSLSFSHIHKHTHIQACLDINALCPLFVDGRTAVPVYTNIPCPVGSIRSTAARTLCEGTNERATTSSRSEHCVGPLAPAGSPILIHSITVDNDRLNGPPAPDELWVIPTSMDVSSMNVHTLPTLDELLLTRHHII